jgi:hypothetical protein
VAPPRWLIWSGLGWDGRTIIIVLAALGGLSVLGGLLVLGIVVWSLLLVFIASVQWLASAGDRD